MVKKYSRLLEDRIVNDKTDSVWAIQDVPKTWRSKTEAKVIEEGYHFLDDGTAEKNSEEESEVSA